MYSNEFKPNVVERKSVLSVNRPIYIIKPTAVMDVNDHGSQTFTLLNLPNEIFQHIISYLSFEKISELRLVSQAFNVSCQRLLNLGFAEVEKNHAKCLKNVKSKLPRRESERKNHPLARKCDILNSIETRLSLLNMTYVKYMDLNMCCFIPGKVIDEIKRVLVIVKAGKPLPRAFDLLQELRDLSSMAMEHFDEKILPSIKNKMLDNSPSTSFTGSYLLPGYSSSSITLRVGKFSKPDLAGAQKLQQNASVLAIIRKSLTNQKQKMSDMRKKIQSQDKIIHELNHTISDLNVKISEQEGRLNEFGRKLMDLSTCSAHTELVIKKPMNDGCPELRRSSRLRDAQASSNTPNPYKRKCVLDETKTEINEKKAKTSFKEQQNTSI